MTDILTPEPHASLWGRFRRSVFGSRALKQNQPSSQNIKVPSSSSGSDGAEELAAFSHERVRCLLQCNAERQSPRNHKLSLSFTESDQILSESATTVDESLSPRKENEAPENKSTPMASFLNAHVATNQGSREYQEDRSFAQSLRIGDYICYVVGVADGHGGPECSSWLARAMPSLIERTLKENTDGLDDTRLVRKILRYCILQAERLLWERWLQKRFTSGSTLCMMIIVPELLYAVVANVGDSRLAVLDRNSMAYWETSDHIPEEKEAQRIQNARGWISFANGIPRLNGILSLSRSLGDFMPGLKIDESRQLLKNPPLSAEPDISLVSLQPQGQYLFLLATDGAWHQIPKTTLHDIIHTSPQGSSIVRNLVSEALRISPSDNITAISLELKLK